MKKYGPINNFTDIGAYKIGKEIIKLTYGITDKLPSEEKYGLSSQMRRAAVSFTANIAEGYGRYHFKENIQFCLIGRGSMYELQDHIISCKEIGFIKNDEFQNIFTLTENALKALNGYIRLLKRLKLKIKE